LKHFCLVGAESTNVEPLQFDLVIIKAATNNFSDENKIGKGGFGEVYKVGKIWQFYFLFELVLHIIK